MGLAQLRQSEKYLLGAFLLGQIECSDPIESVPIRRSPAVERKMNPPGTLFQFLYHNPLIPVVLVQELRSNGGVSHVGLGQANRGIEIIQETTKSRGFNRAKSNIRLGDPGKQE